MHHERCATAAGIGVGQSDCVNSLTAHTIVLIGGMGAGVGVDFTMFTLLARQAVRAVARAHHSSTGGFSLLARISEYWFA